MSLGMGAMITYGSYLSKKENIVKNSALIVIADSIVALMAGLAVIPAAVANGIANGTPLSDIALGGPKLLFVTLQDVFANMGAVGPLFGIVFYLLVIIAAISSAISLMEVVPSSTRRRALSRRVCIPSAMAVSRSVPVSQRWEIIVRIRGVISMIS